MGRGGSPAPDPSIQMLIALVFTWYWKPSDRPQLKYLEISNLNGNLNRDLGIPLRKPIISLSGYKLREVILASPQSVLCKSITSDMRDQRSHTSKQILLITVFMLIGTFLIYVA